MQMCTTATLTHITTHIQRGPNAHTPEMGPPLLSSSTDWLHDRLDTCKLPPPAMCVNIMTMTSNGYREKRANWGGELRLSEEQEQTLLVSKSDDPKHLFVWN